MENAIILSDTEVKKIIAKAYGVDEKQVARMQYSYVVKGIIEQPQNMPCEVR